MKKLFAATLFVLLSLQYGYSSELNITLTQAGDLINQVDINKLDEVEKLTISGDINGTDVFVIRKMVNLQEIDLSSINGVQIDNDNTIQSVYSVNGMKFNDSDTSVLPKGVYIINGKKRLIK
jgi:hypothetical protein